MAVFHSTGKDENFQMLTGEQLAMGGKPGEYLRSVTSESWLSLIYMKGFFEKNIIDSWVLEVNNSVQ